MDEPVRVSADSCFHCHGKLPHGNSAATPITLNLGADNAVVCSEKCATTVRNIFTSGLGEFYQHRASPEAPDSNEKPANDWGTYERPAVMREFVREQNDGSKIADLLIQGVHCAACTWLIENTLTKIPGVRSIEVNPVTTRGELHWEPAQVSLATLLAEIEKIGYLPTPFTEQAHYSATEQERRLALRRLVVAGLGMMQVSSFAIALYAGAFQGMDPVIQEFLRLISLIVATPIVLYSGAPFFAGAWRNIKSRSLGMDVPVALAIGAAWSASTWNTFAGTGEVYFDSATMFVFFLSGTRYLEAAGRRRALELTNSLAQHLPCTATRITASGSEEIGVMELETHDRVKVLPGIAFPADGTLEDGITHVDESMLTGESRPVARGPGDAVVAGTVNLSNTAVVKIEKTGADTVLAQIGRLVTLAGSTKPKLVQTTDRIASVFVTVVLLLAAGTAIGWLIIDADRAFEIVLTVLVVTCPCALALATPAAFTVATSTLARQGFLVRRSGALQTLAACDHIVFDKTGTLTQNTLEICAVETPGSLDALQALTIAAALETHSAHPIARAFRNEATKRQARNIKNIPGGGLEGEIDQDTYRIGTYAFVAGSSATDNSPADQDDALRNIWLGNSKEILAKFSIREELRAGAEELFLRFREQHIDTSIASGDRAGSVAALARKLGATEWAAEMLPEDKLQRVQTMQQAGKVVAVVGDGINDSPVLAGASVSVAMGSGTSIAQHSADCVWMGNELTGLDSAFQLAKRTMRIVKQNLVWALGYNTLAIPLAITGSIQPWMAALGMSLSSLLVMLNALRLSRADKMVPDRQPVEKSCCSKQPGLAT